MKSHHVREDIFLCTGPTTAKDLGENDFYRIHPDWRKPIEWLNGFKVVCLLMFLFLMSGTGNALENQFGGYFRTRAYTETNFTGEDVTEAKDLDRIDTRTRIFYTAKFHENLKFVNKFEMNAVWGGAGTYGQLGADGANLVVKNSYVDFKVSDVRFSIGVQDFVLARGYLFNDDIAGVKAIFKVSDSVSLPIYYLKMYEGGSGKKADDYDLDACILYPTFHLNRETVLKPHFSWIGSDDYSQASTKGSVMNRIPGATKLKVYSGGLEVDSKMGMYTVGATGIFQFGTIDVPPASYNGHERLDFKGYLVDVFGSVNLGMPTLRIKGIYASGNDRDSYSSGNVDAFFNPGGPGATGTGAQYSWAEIMGLGIFDSFGIATADDPKGVYADKISNRIIGNLGVTYSPTKDMKIATDLWYAKTAKDVKLIDGTYGNELGTEIDVVITYVLMDNLKLDLVGAYLWAGDVVNKAVSATDAADPYEFGAQLSLAF